MLHCLSFRILKVNENWKKQMKSGEAAPVAAETGCRQHGKHAMLLLCHLSFPSPLYLSSYTKCTNQADINVLLWLVRKASLAQKPSDVNISGSFGSLVGPLSTNTRVSGSTPGSSWPNVKRPWTKHWNPILASSSVWSWLTIN